MIPVQVFALLFQYIHLSHAQRQILHWGHQEKDLLCDKGNVPSDTCQGTGTEGYENGPHLFNLLLIFKPPFWPEDFWCWENTWIAIGNVC
jgi:hypothetical protein